MTNTILSNLHFETHPIHAITEDGITWFRASQIAKALQYGNYRQAVKTHVEDEDVQFLDTPTDSGIQSIKYINESGMYALIFGSKRPEAKRFKRWVTAEVLPTIRESGSFAVEMADDDRIDDLQAELLKARPLWQDIIRYKAMGLSTSEIAKLIGRGKSTVSLYIRTMSKLGFGITPEPQPKQLQLEMGV